VWEIQCHVFQTLRWRQMNMIYLGKIMVILDPIRTWINGEQAPEGSAAKDHSPQRPAPLDRMIVSFSQC